MPGQASPESGLTREDLDFAYQHAYEYPLGTSRDPDPEQEERALDYAAWYLAAYRDEESMADLPDHRHAWARFADQGYPAREPTATGTTADGLLNAAVDRRPQADGEQNPVSDRLADELSGEPSAPPARSSRADRLRVPAAAHAPAAAGSEPGSAHPPASPSAGDPGHAHRQHADPVHSRSGDRTRHQRAAQEAAPAGRPRAS